MAGQKFYLPTWGVRRHQIKICPLALARKFLLGFFRAEPRKAGNPPPCKSDLAGPKHQLRALL